MMAFEQPPMEIIHIQHIYNIGNIYNGMVPIISDSGLLLHSSLNTRLQNTMTRDASSTYEDRQPSYSFVRNKDTKRSSLKMMSAAATEGQLIARPIIETHGDRFNSCQVIYSQFGLAIHQNDHQARRRFVEWAQNEIAVVPDFHKRILFSDEEHFWLNGYVNKQNCRIWREANPQVYVETPLHPEKLTVWCALWAGGILLQKR
ncbi:hypothetical protein TNCV_4193991 [Trichonephila clavipes]|nr:hypothetical protein TNCV_4193991 [Trichonephila clavipes]